MRQSCTKTEETEPARRPKQKGVESESPRMIEHFAKREEGLEDTLGLQRLTAKGSGSRSGEREKNHLVPMLSQG